MVLEQRHGQNILRKSPNSPSPIICNFYSIQKFLRDYEVLVSDHQEYLHWRKASSGLPLRPVTGGCDSKGQGSLDTVMKVS